MGMNGSSVLVSAILGAVGGGLTALLIALVPGLRGRKELRGVAGALGAILAVTMKRRFARSGRPRHRPARTRRGSWR